jgi:hypothetical protein
MTLTKWVLLILFVVGYFFLLAHLEPFREAISQYGCQVVSVIVILGGAYGLWSGRMIGEYGIQLHGAWAYIFGLAAIVLGVWILIEGCPTFVVP